MSQFHQQVVCLVLILTSVKLVDAILCYECNGYTDSKCNEPFTSTVTCDAGKTSCSKAKFSNDTGNLCNFALTNNKFKQEALGETRAAYFENSAFREERCSVSPIPVAMATTITADSDSLLKVC